MEIITHSTISYWLKDKYFIVANSNNVIVTIVNPILCVTKCQDNKKKKLVITNNTGIDLNNIIVFCNKKIIIDKLLKNNTKIISCEKTNKILLKYKMCINNQKNTIYIQIK